MSSLIKLSSSRSFEGYQNIYEHASTELQCVMKFGAYVPPQAETEKLPVIFWLSGLTCSEKNFIEKAGAQKYAREHGIIIINPDTSPRNVNIEGEDESYDFGSGAGFYLDATEEKWKKNYRMYSYVTKELPALIAENFNADINRMGIMGHSMGGHGALICSLKNPGLYKSVSAFSPICNPINCKWGKKAFTGYLGDNIEAWKEYDSCELVKKYSGPPLQIWVDQGLADQFYTEKQLLPENLVDACASVGVPIVMRKHENYDHSYYFIATFLEDHIKHHMKFLKN